MAAATGLAGVAGLQVLGDVSAAAVPGELDVSFAGDGLDSTNIGSLDRANGVGIQADGKIVIAGRTASLGGDIAVLRFLPGGGLDTGFGTGGVVTTDVAGGFDEAAAVVIQPDQKIVVGGVATEQDNRNFALVRYNPNGSPDSTFGGDGLVTTDVTGGDDEVYGLAIQPDGKIVAAGAATLVGDFALARYGSDGALDGGFGSGGLVTTDFAGESDQARGVAIQPNGMVVAAGRADVAGNPRFGLARYGVDGALDGGFGSGGLVTTDFGPGIDQAFGVAVQGDDKIVAAGLATVGGSGDVGLVRYTTAGSLDGSFGTGGKQTSDFGGGFDAARGVAVQPNGKIVAAGLATVGGNANIGLARYTTAGVLDSTFGTGGLVDTDVGAGADQALAVAIQPNDGKIVVAGEAEITGNANFLVGRYQGDGGPTADVSIVKADSPDPVVVGGTLTYTLSVANAGPAVATGVALSDTLPGSVSLVSVTPSQGACSPGATVSCVLGTLASGGEATVTIVVSPGSPGVLNNAVSVSSGVFDPVPANNVDSETTTVTSG